MASIPVDHKEESRGGGKPPISAHSAFPAVVALWFAALLGLGSLILPVQLIERLVTMTGVASLVPAAAPPLGFTARAAIALAATVLGALIGMVAARRVAAANSDADADAAFDPRLAFDAEAEMDHEGIEPDYSIDDEHFDAPELTKPEPPKAGPHRRRPLAMQEEEGLSDFLMAAPLPGADDKAHAADFDTVGETLDLSADNAVENEDEVEDHVCEDDGLDDADMRQEFIPSSQVQETAAPIEMQIEETGDQAAPEPLAFSPPSMARQPEHDEPRAFDAPVTEQDAMADDAQPSDDEEMTEDFVQEKQIFQPAEPVAYEPAPAEEPQSDEPGLVQLVQKLGSTLEKHREWSAQRAAQLADAEEAPEPPVIPETASPTPQVFEAAPPEDAAEAMAAYFGKPADQTAPEAPETPEESKQKYAPLDQRVLLADERDDDGDDVSELAASFTLPITREEGTGQQPIATTPRPAFDVPPHELEEQAELEPEAEPESEQDPVAQTAEAASEEAAPPASPYIRDAAYGSLSSVSNPFKQQSQQFVRVEEPESDVQAVQPAVVFPNQEARKPADLGDTQPAEPRTQASNDDNERALREALMNLQRMGK